MHALGKEVGQYSLPIFAVLALSLHWWIVPGVHMMFTQPAHTEKMLDFIVKVKTRSF